MYAFGTTAPVANNTVSGSPHNAGQLALLWW